MNTEEKKGTGLQSLLWEWAEESQAREVTSETSRFLERCQAAGAAAFALRDHLNSDAGTADSPPAMMDRLLDFVRAATSEQRYFLEAHGIDNAQPTKSAAAWGRLCRQLNIPREQALIGYRQLVTTALEPMMMPRFMRARGGTDLHAGRVADYRGETVNDEPLLSPQGLQLYRDALRDFLEALLYESV